MNNVKHRLLVGALTFCAVCVVGLVVFIVVFAHQAEVSGVEKAQIGAVVGRYAQQVEDSIMGKSPESETSDEQKQVVAESSTIAKKSGCGISTQSVWVWPDIISITKTKDGYTVRAYMSMYFNIGESSSDGCDPGWTDEHIIQVKTTSYEAEDYTVVSDYIIPHV
jgi:hypothetical protein